MTSTSESALRKRADWRGYKIEKSRGQEHLNNRGQFMLTRLDDNIPVLGWNYDAELNDIAAYLNEGETP